MAEHATHWERIVGDGLVYDGPCIVKSVVVYPDAANDYADVYDGRDTTSGKKYSRFCTQQATTVPFNLGDGVQFGRGIYVDGKDSAVETTVGFIPLIP